MNVLGDDDDRILRHSYLNSSFQTGLKNLLDLAIINRGNENGLNALTANYMRIDEIPFDFVRRRMSVILQYNAGKRQLITKGAVEEILEVSKYIEVDGQLHELDENMRALAMSTYLKHNDEGLRMIAVAQKNDVPPSGQFSVKDESDLILIGFVGFLDPPKESARDAITDLREHGVRTVVLTGDSEGVAKKVCQKVGVDSALTLTGAKVDQMDDDELLAQLKICDVFAKLSPASKERIVGLLKQNGHTVGFMGDGINDAPALNRADVGISVDTAVDVAKETAQIILLQKDLRVLSNGVISGRETFCNIIKYLKMAVSGNFGNMISVIVASVTLPFLPMLPVQILAQNLLTDFSQIGMPFDKVDREYIQHPKKWEVKSIRSFMFAMGPLSSIFDILLFVAMWYIIGANTIELAPLFQCGWFVFGTVSQIIVIYTCRTSKLPFIESAPSLPLLLSTLSVGAIAVMIGFTPIARLLDMEVVGQSYIIILVALLILYFISAGFVKALYIKRKGQWI
jgi:Mg2+-importing ATPase